MYRTVPLVHGCACACACALTKEAARPVAGAPAVHWLGSMAWHCCATHGPPCHKRQRPHPAVAGCLTCDVVGHAAARPLAQLSRPSACLQCGNVLLHLRRVDALAPVITVPVRMAACVGKSRAAAAAVLTAVLAPRACCCIGFGGLRVCFGVVGAPRMCVCVWWLQVARDLAMPRYLRPLGRQALSWHACKAQRGCLPSQ